MDDLPDLMRPLQIARGDRSILLRVPVGAAPMAGVVDPPYRALLHRHGCPLSFTEMLSSKGLVEAMERTLELIGQVPTSGHCGIQLFGSEPEVMGEAAARVSDLGFHAIDINAGCPKRKVHSQGSGGALMRTPSKLLSLVSAVLDSTSLPVGAKLRSGWQSYDRNRFLELIGDLSGSGLSWICVHPRTVAQGFSGRADLDVVSDAGGRSSVPVIASGDVRAPCDLAPYFRAGASGVLVGRALMGDPGWFRRLDRSLFGGRSDEGDIVDGGFLERAELAREHLALSVGHHGEEKGCREFRTHLSWYLKGVPGRADLNREVFSVSNVQDVDRVLMKALRAVGPI